MYITVANRQKLPSKVYYHNLLVNLNLLSSLLLLIKRLINIFKPAMMNALLS